MSGYACWCTECDGSGPGGGPCGGPDPGNPARYCGLNEGHPGDHGAWINNTMDGGGPR